MNYTSERKNAIVARLAALGVVKCLVCYSGGGDNGAIDTIEAFLTDDAKETHNIDDLVQRLETDKAKIAINVRDRLLGAKTTTFNKEIENLAYDALDAADVGDWINNDGGSGTLTIDVAGGIITIEHTAYGETVYESEDDDEGTEGASEESSYTLD